MNSKHKTSKHLNNPLQSRSIARLAADIAMVRRITHKLAAGPNFSDLGAVKRLAQEMEFEIRGRMFQEPSQQALEIAAWCKSVFDEVNSAKTKTDAVALSLLASEALGIIVSIGKG